MKGRGLFGSHYKSISVFLLFVLSYWQSCWGMENRNGTASNSSGRQIQLTATFTKMHLTGSLSVEKPSIYSTEVREFGAFQPASPDSPEQLNPGKVFLQSLLLPGWGELRTGAIKRATGFLISEGLLWSTFAALQIYAHWREWDYKDFAANHADVQVVGKDKDYFTHLSFFDNIYEYNEEKRRLRRYDEVYPVDEEHFWQWDSETSRSRFKSLRHSSEQAYRTATLTIGVVLLNHLFSAIDAIWTTRQHNKELKTPANWKIESHVKYYRYDAPCFQASLVRFF